MNKNKINDIFKQYFYAGLIPSAIIHTLINGFSKNALELVRLSMQNKVQQKLKRKYKKTCQKFVENRKELSIENKESKKVWICWLQGVDNAPYIVQKCIKSIQENLYDREVIILTEENYRDYVKFPEKVQEKIDNGIITRTHFSDLLRIELLTTYGGTWIDATVYCSNKEIPNYFFESDLFMYQILKPGRSGHSAYVSTWFMNAKSNNDILELTKHLLYTYWERNSHMIDYFLLHQFICIAAEYYKEEWENMIPLSSSTPHILLLRLFKKYDNNIWTILKDQSPFHKLTYKFEESQTTKKGTYYEKIFLD